MNGLNPRQELEQLLRETKVLCMRSKASIADFRKVLAETKVLRRRSKKMLRNGSKLSATQA